MIEDQDLRERLRTVDVPPTWLTTTALVAAGRRRAGRRRAVRTGCGVALAAALAVAVPSVVVRALGEPADSAAGPGGRTVRCAAAELPAPAGTTRLEAEAVDPTGRYILANDIIDRAGNSTGKDGNIGIRPVLWTDGQPRALPLTGAPVRAAAVNARGMVAAVAGPHDDRGRWASVVRYVDGVPEALHAPLGTWFFDDSPKIDADGDVLAVAYRRNKPRDPDIVIWKAGSTSATTLLTLPDGIESMTVRVTDAGTVIGNVAAPTAAGKHTVIVWDQQGRSRELATPVGDGAYNFAARGDWVTANLTASGTVARWNLATGKVDDTGVGAPANGVNALGWVLAGESVQRDDATVELATPDGFTVIPADVSDTGVVVGSLYDYGRSGPTPAPSRAPGSSASGLYTWQCDR